MAIGKKVSKKDPLSFIAKLHKDVGNMPHLLLQARLIANTLMAGYYSQRKRGNGDNFWQFRLYVEGESTTHIDWRRSARDEHTYLREREWETAQTVWIWPDQSASMHYCSRFSKISKGNYAIILSLALATLLARDGQYIAIPDLMAPTITSNVAERMAMALTNHQVENSFPDFSAINRFSQVIIISDFLDQSEKIIQHLRILVAKQVNVHLIEVADPAEESFPYKGRTEFFDPETKQKLLLGKAESFRKHYCKLYQKRREKLINFCSHQGWSYHVNTTDRPLKETILQLTNRMNASVPYTGRAL
ncbi:DUF58 domain-containing protein [Bartonella bovis]|uniref:DUF58 domain-containing protein n=1 Tax=Bartonella bovis 91-4 TaxID=1094491 RepID=N6VD81_9HYPH|nr:DUF58 domain-containing protein [Bartonella bovis]ENN91246.1 hypothetical protein BBbe_09410 [Bartonella bovis 91-4]